MTKLKYLLRILIPDWLIRFFLKLIDIKFDNSLVIGFSQQAEDLTIERYVGDRLKGFYIDIGAFHPIKYSNTYMFYRKGWSGINIEPNPDAISQFNKYRNRDLNLNMGIGDTEGSLSYYSFNAPALNTFDAAHAKTWSAREGFKILNTIPVNVFPLKSVLQKHLPKGQKIDFMSIDVEGFDLKVLQSNDWDLFRPEYLIVEESIYQYKAFSDCPIVAYLNTNNYSLACITGGSIVFRDDRK